jgi:ATP-dependent protease ClpP protease subunit
MSGGVEQLVPAVTELVIAELLYLQWLDPRQPTYVYINSTGTSRADGETVLSHDLLLSLTCLIVFGHFFCALELVKALFIV